MKEIFNTEILKIKPEFMKSAAAGNKGLNLILEILIGAAVFLTATLIQSGMMIVYCLILLLTDDKFLSMVVAGESNGLIDRIMSIYSMADFDLFMLITCFVNIAIAILAAKLFQRRSLKTMGFVKRDSVFSYAKGMLFGAGAFYIILLICIVFGAIKPEGYSLNGQYGTLILFFIGFLIQGMGEEAICRGFMMVSISRKHSLILSAVVNSLFFAALHLFNSGISVIAFINLFLFGILMSVYMIYSENIWGVAAFHSIWNFVQGNVCGIKVSGGEMGCSVFSFSAVEGRELLNGGAFGIEGGIITTLVLLIAIAVLLFMNSKKDIIRKARIRENSKMNYEFE